MPTTFRPATVADVPMILSFIRALAAYEKISHTVTVDADQLAKTMFGARVYAECILAECDGAAAGFVIFCHNYSTFLGKPGIHIEDVFVHPQFRAHGIGKGFFRAIARIAQARDCGRIEWWCLDWNQPALDFYDKLGAQKMDAWTPLRLDRAAIDALAATDKT